MASIARCFTSKLWKYPSGALGDGVDGVELDHVEPNRFLASTRVFSQCQGRKGYFLIIYIIFPYAPWDGDIYLYFPFECSNFSQCDSISSLISCIHIYMIQAPWFPPTPPPKGGIGHTYAAIYGYNYMFVLIDVCMPVCLSVCLLVCKYVRVPARSTCHCFCVCTQRYYMYT